MDKLDLPIENKRREIADLKEAQRREVEELRGKHTLALAAAEAQLRQLLEEAAKLLLEEAAALASNKTEAQQPVIPSEPAASKPTNNGHRKPKGAISLQWRDILRHMVLNGNPVRSFDAIDKLVENSGMNIEVKSVKDRLSKYVTAGILDTSSDGYRVSRMAINRYGLNRKAGT